MQSQLFRKAWVLGLALLVAAPVWAQRGQGRGANGPGNSGACRFALINSIPKQSLDPAEVEGLKYMREEEKLAHDVYVVLQSKWNLRIFGNISPSEDRHVDAVKLLLDRYGLPDPAADLGMGAFQNPGLQKLYANLIEQGTSSLKSAFRVGATIEDLDIHDLEKAAAATDNADLKLVYQNLRQASENHLRAFVRQLAAAGETYTPQYITPESFSELVSQQTGAGFGAGGNGQRGRGRGNNGVCPWK